MTDNITRFPIITRVPIMKNTLAYDAIMSSFSMEDLLTEIDSIDCSDPRVMVDDAFARRFPSIWALKYRTLKGKPMRFKSTRNPYSNRPWQRQILDDNHPNKVVEKSRQLGLSEMNVTEIVHFLAAHPDTKAVYTFPTYRQLNDFSVSRLSPIFRGNINLGNLLSKEVNNVSTKKIGDSYLFMRSSSNSAAGEGVDADSA